MRLRCDNTSSISYPNYGGRGIAYAHGWKLFDNFLSDMGECPDGGSLDRIDLNGDYGPDNCRWATRTEQNRNTRRVRLTADIASEIRRLRAQGIKLREIADKFGVGISTVANVIYENTWRK